MKPYTMSETVHTEGKVEDCSISSARKHLKASTICKRHSPLLRAPVIISSFSQIAQKGLGPSLTLLITIHAASRRWMLALVWGLRLRQQPPM